MADARLVDQLCTATTASLQHSTHFTEHIRAAASAHLVVLDVLLQQCVVCLCELGHQLALLLLCSLLRCWRWCCTDRAWGWWDLFSCLCCGCRGLEGTGLGGARGRWLAGQQLQLLCGAGQRCLQHSDVILEAADPGAQFLVLLFLHAGHHRGASGQCVKLGQSNMVSPCCYNAVRDIMRCIVTGLYSLNQARGSPDDAVGSKQ
jgi:hypothetical protein